MRGPDVEPQRLLEVLIGGIQERVRNRPTDVVHHHVKPTERTSRNVSELRHGTKVRQVRSDDLRTAPRRFNPSGHRSQLRLRTRRQHHIGSDLCQRHGRSGANPSTRAGDHRNPIGQVESVENHG